jgi:hypothetical protein
MHIQILGPSCANCLKLEVLAMETLTELGIRDARVEKITTPREMEHLMSGDPPGLVIDGQWGLVGRKRPANQNTDCRVDS